MMTLLLFMTKYLSHKLYDGGIALQAAMTGPPPSSTRAAALGIIAATWSPIPVCCGLDNKAAFDMGQFISQQLRDDLQHQPKVPYPLRKDGDLWAIFHANVKAFGPLSIQLIKVKGQATVADVTTDQQKT